MNRSCCASYSPCSITVLRPFSLATLVVWVVPKAFTDLVVSDDTYHIVALVSGSVAAVAAIVGMFVLIGRRVSNSRARSGYHS